MPTDRAELRRARAGGLIILALAAIALTIVFIGDLKESVSETFEVVGIFPRAERVQPGTPVWIAGREVGEVISVSFLPPALDTVAVVAVRMKLPLAHYEQVRADSEIRIATAQILGPPVIQIRPGSATSRHLREGEALRANREDRFGELVASAEEVRLAFDPLRSSADRVVELLKERRPVIESARRELAVVSGETGELVTAVRAGPLPAAMGDDGVRARIAELRRNTARVSAALDRALAFPPELRGRREAAEASIRARISALEEEIARAEEALEAPSGTAGRLISDEALGRALEGAQAQADSLMSELRSAPWRLFF